MVPLAVSLRLSLNDNKNPGVHWFGIREIRAVVLSWAETTVRCTNIREAGSTPAPSTITIKILHLKLHLFNLGVTRL